MLAPPPYEDLPLTDCSKIALKAVICFFKTIRIKILHRTFQPPHKYKRGMDKD